MLYQFIERRQSRVEIYDFRGVSRIEPIAVPEMPVQALQRRLSLLTIDGVRFDTPRLAHIGERSRDSRTDIDKAGCAFPWPFALSQT